MSQAKAIWRAAQGRELRRRVEAMEAASLAWAEEDAKRQWLADRRREMEALVS